MNHLKFERIYESAVFPLPIFPKDCPRTKDLIAIWSAILTSGRFDLGMEAKNHDEIMYNTMLLKISFEFK